MLTCEHDNYSTYYWILTEICFEGVENLGHVRRWAIQLKGCGNGG